MARTSSLNCLSCKNPYQTPHSLNPSPLFTENPLFLTEKCFVGSPAQKSALIRLDQVPAPSMLGSGGSVAGTKVLILASITVCPGSDEQPQGLKLPHLVDGGQLLTRSLP